MDNFFNKEIDGANESIIEKIVYMDSDQNNKPISNQIPKVQGLLTQVTQSNKENDRF